MREVSGAGSGGAGGGEARGIARRTHACAGRASTTRALCSSHARSIDRRSHTQNKLGTSLSFSRLGFD